MNYDRRPTNCRDKLQELMRPYPKSSCQICGTVLRKDFKCPYKGENDVTIDMRTGEEDRVQIQTPVTAHVERSFTFTEEAIKEILAAYVSENFRVKATPKDVQGEYREASGYGPFDQSPGYCKFVVTVKEK